MAREKSKRLCDDIGSTVTFVFAQDVSDISIDVVNLSISACMRRVEYLRVHCQMRGFFGVLHSDGGETCHLQC